MQANSGFKVVDLRWLWLPDGQSEIRATRKSDSLEIRRVPEMTSLLPDIEKVVPELTDVQPCYMRSDHCNQLGALSCFECNPNGADGY